MRRILLVAVAILGCVVVLSGRARGADEASALDAGGCFSSPGRPDASVFATREERRAAAWRKEFYEFHPPVREQGLGEAVPRRDGRPNEDNQNPQPDHENPENRNPQPDHLAGGVG